MLQGKEYHHMSDRRERLTQKRTQSDVHIFIEDYKHRHNLTTDIDDVLKHSVIMFDTRNTKEREDKHSHSS